VTSTSRFAKAATCCHPTRRSAGGGDEHLASLRLAPSTDASYRKLWRLYIKPHLGEVPLDKLTGTAITTMYRKLETGGRRDGKPGQGLKPRTIRYVHTTLNASLDEAVAQGLLAVNPARKAKPPAAREAKAPRSTHGTLRTLPPSSAWLKSRNAPTLWRGVCWPSRVDDAVSCWRIAGATSTWMPGVSASAAQSASSNTRASRPSSSRALPSPGGSESSTWTRRPSRPSAATEWQELVCRSNWPATTH
jgi:hypothetical protein